MDLEFAGAAVISGIEVVGPSDTGFFGRRFETIKNVPAQALLFDPDDQFGFPPGERIRDLGALIR